MGKDVNIEYGNIEKKTTVTSKKKQLNHGLDRDWSGAGGGPGCVCGGGAGVCVCVMIIGDAMS